MLKVNPKDMILSIGVSIIAVLVYANSLGNGFVTDDPGVILDNPVLQGSPLAVLNAMDTLSDTQLLPFYRPFTYLTFAFEGRLHGFDPLFMHLLNVLLHAFNVFLVYWLARSLFDDHRPAILASMLFAVHPIHAESVNFLAGGRNTMLACLFVLLTYHAHQRSIERKNVYYALLGAGFFFLGVCSKELAMMVLPLILMREIMFAREHGYDTRATMALRAAPYIAATMVYLVLRWLALSKFGVQESIIPGLTSGKMTALYDIPGLKERLIDNIYIVPRYLLTIVWPAALTPNYEIPRDLRAIAPQLIVGWSAILVLLALLLGKARSKTTLFGLSWIVMFWLPVSGLFYFSIFEMADRYFYLPAIGLWIVIADQSLGLLRAGKITGRHALIAISILVAVLAAVTMRRNLDWKSDITLFTRMVTQYPDNAYGLHHLGAAQLVRNDPNDLDDGETNLKRALDLAPNTEFVQPLLGYARLQRGDLEGALKYLSDALALQPMDREARINRGITYEQMGRNREALADYEFYLNIPGQNDLPGSREYALERLKALSP